MHRLGAPSGIRELPDLTVAAARRALAGAARALARGPQARSSCPAELDAVGHGLDELRLGELVARLESGRARPAPQRQMGGCPPAAAGSGEGSDQISRPSDRRTPASRTPTPAIRLPHPIV